MSETVYWRCDLCGCTGSDFYRRDDSMGWTVCEAIVTLHRSASEGCHGGGDTIRVSRRPIPRADQEAKP